MTETNDGGPVSSRDGTIFATFPRPWRVEQTRGCTEIVSANGHSIVEFVPRSRDGGSIARRTCRAICEAMNPQKNVAPASSMNEMDALRGRVEDLRRIVRNGERLAIIEERLDAIEARLDAIANAARGNDE